MKNFYLILLTVFVSSYCLSQQKYHPLLKNTTWYQVASMAGSGYYWYHKEKDTVINAKTYAKYTTPGAPGFKGATSYLLREDTIQRKVWKIDYGQSTEYLMYDFTLNVGGKLPVYQGGILKNTETVWNVDSVLTNVGYRRRMQLGVDIIEGVGSTEEVMMVKYFKSDPAYQLVCSHQDNQMIYNNAFYTCMQYNSVEDNTHIGYAVSAYPNPSSGKFAIEAVSEHYVSNKYKMEIYNVFGEQVFQSIIFNQLPIAIGTEIDISSQPNGVYFLKLKTDAGIATKKIVISH